MKLTPFRLAVAALLLTANSASAQIVNTGVGVAAGDANWTVKLFNKDTPNMLLYNGQAQRITSIPSVWQVNNSPVANWIGVSRTGSFSSAGAGAINFRYIFTTNLLGMQSFAGSIGWDNRMVGYSFDGGQTITPFSPIENFDAFGFCRTSDGEFNSMSPSTACTRDFTVSPTTGAQAFSVIIDGDLGTDGILIQNTSTVPEPSTFVLVAAGLAGLGAVARRRRTTQG